MKRRDFIKNTAAVTVLPSLINGQTVQAFTDSSLLSRLAASFVDTDHVLVIVQLNGGNDGLNMVIPLDQYGNLANARSNILIDSKKVLALTGTSVTGLHPSMTGMRDLYNNGKLTIVQAAGYPNQNYSHFRSSDIWVTAADYNQSLTNGWAGRYLSEEFPNFPSGYPNTNMPDPLAIQIGSVVSTGLQGLTNSMAMAISDPANFYGMINGTTDPTPNTHAGAELAYIRGVSAKTQQYSTVIKAAAAKAANKSTIWPTAGQNKLADQMKIVSQLIAGGLKTRIYWVSLGGFDTHSNQVDATNGNETGAHASLLGDLSEAITAFMDDCKLLNTADRVLGMTFSEFGRRIVSNASLGTDHGAAAPLFLFGNKVKSGILGSNPTIPSNATVNDNVAMQHDFRTVYTSILKDWFCLSDTDADTVMLQKFNGLNLINNSCNNNAIAQDIQRNSGNMLIRNYPNPFNLATTIEFISAGGNVLIELINIEGKLVKTVADQNYAIGQHNIELPRNGIAAGLYYLKLQNNLNTQTRSMIVTD